MIDDRQFILLRDHSVEKPDWLSISLTNGFVLYYHKDLNVARDNSNKFLLLGYAWQVVQGKKAPSEIIEAWGNSPSGPSRDEIIEEEKTWCGRYLLIVEDWIFLDAAGLLGVFYGKDVVTSSLHVLCDVMGIEMKYPSIKHREDPDYVPGYWTPYEGISRLLPSQILNYVTGSPCFRPILPDGEIKYKDNSEQIDKFAECFITSMHNMRDVFPGQEIMLALTGGYDSRFVLSILNKSDIPFSVFTLWHGTITRGDVDVPKMIGKIIPQPYRFIERDDNSFSPQRYDDYQKHTAGMAVDEDWNLYAYHQYQDLKKDKEKIVILRCGVLEIVAYGKDFPSLEKIDWTTVFPQLDPKSFKYQALIDWARSAAHDSVNLSITPYERQYAEMRIGCWLSSIEQSLDIIDDITSIQPFNSRYVLSLLKGFDEGLRRTKRHEYLIVKRFMPILTLFPYRRKYEKYIGFIRRHLHLSISK